MGHSSVTTGGPGTATADAATLLAPHTTLGLGGPARALVRPTSEAGVVAAARARTEKEAGVIAALEAGRTTLDIYGWN